MIHSSSAAPSRTPQTQPTYAKIVKPLPSRKQAMLFPAIDEVPILDYIISVGRLIGPKKIVSASKISKKRICIYLDDEKMVDYFLSTYKTILLNDQIIEARKLVASSRKLILSNVHSCIPNSLILEELQKHKIKTTSAIFDLHIGTSSNKYDKLELEQYTHISSFRRGVYIDCSDETKIPDSLLIFFEGELYRIFVNENELRCHICKQNGHNAAQCLEEDMDTPIPNNFQDPVTNSLDVSLNLNGTESQKRPLSTTDSVSTVDKSATMDNPPQPDLSQETSTSSTVLKRKPRKRSKTSHSSNTEQSIELSNQSTRELLKPAEQNITLNFQQKRYPLNVSNFALLLDAVKGKTKLEDTRLELN